MRQGTTTVRRKQTEITYKREENDEKESINTFKQPDCPMQLLKTCLSRIDRVNLRARATDLEFLIRNNPGRLVLEEGYLLRRPCIVRHMRQSTLFGSICQQSASLQLTFTRWRSRWMVWCQYILGRPLLFIPTLVSPYPCMQHLCEVVKHDPSSSDTACRSY